MSVLTPEQEPIFLQASSKRDVRTQFAALCYRMVKGKPEILLVTSRRTKRWIIPKGWPMDGKTPGESALTEAWEEAGVIGKLRPRSLGLFSYLKSIDDKTDLPCVAMVYAVKVKSLAAKYPERGERTRKWFSLKKAAERVNEPELAHIIMAFDPQLIKR
jgi:8-oxo-dGTP pyrophosphatase MutT (NUDIX family)